MSTALLPSQDQVIDSLKRNHIAFAALFGSRARGQATPTSDYDFLVEFQEENYSLFDILQIQEDLEKLLTLKVDVITTGGLNPKMKDTILNSMQILYDQR